MPAHVKESPVPESQRRRASANRIRMITSAADLFATVGYAGTTMEAVATAAGMSVQSVYFNFGNKASLLQAAFDHAALTEEGTPPPLSEWYRAAAAEPDADRALVALIAGSGNILIKTGPLTVAAAAAALGDSAAAEVHDRNEGLRMQACEGLARELSAKRSLRSDLTVDKASDIIFGLLSPQLHALLTRYRGWTDEEFLDWVTEAIGAAMWTAEE